MRCQIIVKGFACDRRVVFSACLQSFQIDRWCYAAKNAIGLVAERRLVDDGVKNLWLDLLLLAPVLREDVMDIDVFVEEHCVLEVWPERTSLAPSAIRRAWMPL